MSLLLSCLGGAFGNGSDADKEIIHLSSCGFEPYIEGSENILPVSIEIAECSVSEDADLELLARAIDKACGAEDYAIRVSFGAVIMNRAESDSFPSSISAVIRSAGLYPDSFEDAIPERTIHAARAAMLGIDPTMGALYIMNTSDERFSEYESGTTAIYGNYAFIN